MITIFIFVQIVTSDTLLNTSSRLHRTILTKASTPVVIATSIHTLIVSVIPGCV